MPILLLFAFISGLVTILAPCIWPLLPIVLSATTTGGHRKPLGITLGIITSFAFFTLTISYLVKIIPFDLNILRLLAVLVIGFLGLTLVIPQLSAVLEGWVSRLSGKFISPAPSPSSGFWSGLVTGLSLGIVWSPCAGPILASIATLAATRSVNWQIILVTIVYVIGVGIPLFLFTVAGRRLLTKTSLLSQHTGRIQQIFGAVMILTALAIFTNYDKVIQAKLLDAIPAYSNFLYKLEGNQAVTTQLEKLKGGKSQPSPSPNTIFSPGLPNYGLAPEFVGISKWLNSNPLTIAQLKGRVVLIDFWTYTCINCIRTLPYVTSWYEKYKDKGFVVIGIHTPEFEFEKKTENVQNAIIQYRIHYPVAQDNDYKTWRAYDNHYWPAKYLIDHQGNIRYIHFGEGEYDKTEAAIQKLLSEAGQNLTTPLTNLQDQTPKSQITPETYLGLSRMARFSSKEIPQQGVKNYTLPANLSTNSWAFGGSWDIEQEFASSGANSTLELNFLANKVFLVITPATSSDIIKVSLDGKPTAQITATEPKLYTLVDLKENKGTHLLHLDFPTPGSKIYAFTFGD